jgi:hypothetical protein
MSISRFRSFMSSLITFFSTILIANFSPSSFLVASTTTEKPPLTSWVTTVKIKAQNALRTGQALPPSHRVWTLQLPLHLQSLRQVLATVEGMDGNYDDALFVQDRPPLGASAGLASGFLSPPLVSGFLSPPLFSVCFGFLSPAFPLPFGFFSLLFPQPIFRAKCARYLYWS